jgi:hypothetical protein
MINICKVKKDKAVIGFEFVLASSIAGIDVVSWDKLAASNLFLHSTYLKCIETCGPKNLHHKYFSIQDEKGTAAIFYFQIIDFSGNSFGTAIEKKGETNALKSQFKKLLKRNAKNFDIRLLVSGNTFISGEHGFAFRDDVDSSAVFQLIHYASKLIIDGEKKNEKITAILVKDFTDAAKYNSAFLDKKKYYKFTAEPVMVVNVNSSWNVFNDYLAALSSKYKKRAAAIFKNGTVLKRVSFNSDNIKSNADVINKLYLSVYNNARFRPAALDAAYFAAMQKALPNQFFFTAYYLDNTIVAFRTSFLNKHILEAHFIGLDYEKNKTYNIYPNILYDYLNEAIYLKASKLHFGRTAAEMKSNTGAVPVNLVCFGRHRNAIHNHLIKPFLGHSEPEPWVQRNPFK